MPVMTALALASLGASVGGSIMSGIKNNQNKKLWAGRGQELDDWYKKEYNQDFLNSSVAKSAMTELNRSFREDRQQDDQVSAMTGASAEEQALKDKTRLDSLGQAMNKLASYGTQYKDMVRRNYMTNRNTLDGQIAGANQASANSWSNMAGNAGKAFMGNQEGIMGIGKMLGFKG